MLSLPAGGDIQDFVEKIIADGIRPLSRPLGTVQIGVGRELFWFPVMLALLLIVAERIVGQFWRVGITRVAKRPALRTFFSDRGGESQ